MGFKYLPEDFNLDQFLIGMKNRCDELGIKKAVLGISGGKDSTIVAAIMARVLGAHNVTGILMPCGEQYDLDKAFAAVEATGINHKVVDIGDMAHCITEEYKYGIKKVMSNKAYTNLLPRIRMSILYAYAQSMEQSGVRVIGTTNRSEASIGWGTKWGDLAADFEPIRWFTVHELYELGELLGLPKDLVYKVPEDGLTGKTDEENFGFSYEQLDNFLLHGTSGDPKLDDKIREMCRLANHKFEVVPIYRP